MACPDPLNQRPADSRVEHRLRAAAAATHQSPAQFARSAIVDRIDEVLAGHTVVDVTFFDRLLEEDSGPAEALPWLQWVMEDPQFKQVEENI